LSEELTAKISPVSVSAPGVKGASVVRNVVSFQNEVVGSHYIKAVVFLQSSVLYLHDFGEISAILDHPIMPDMRGIGKSDSKAATTV
jgi:hypothetical protein